VAGLRRQRQFRSLGDARDNPHVGLLFVDWTAPRRLRVNGEAAVSDADPLLGDYPGAQLIVRVRARQIFPNCPRYIHRMQLVENSPFVPERGRQAPRPAWKDNPAYRDALPRRGQLP